MTDEPEAEQCKGVTVLGCSVQYGWVIQYFPFSNITMHGLYEEDLKLWTFE